MTSAVTSRKLSKAAHQSSLAALRERHMSRLGTLPSSDPTLSEIAAAVATQPVTVDAPRRRRPASKVAKAITFTVFRKVWGTVVFTFDLAAEIVAQTGNVVAMFVTPILWGVDNTIALAMRGLAYTWQFLRPNSKGAERAIAFWKPYTLLEEYATSLTILMPLYLLPSWLFQPITGRLAHDLRKYEAYEEIFKADPTSEWSARYYERLDAQLAEYEKEHPAKPKERIKIEEPLTEEQRAAKLSKDGFTEVFTTKSSMSPRELARSIRARGQITRREYFDSFSHLNAAELVVDEFERFWAKAPEGENLFTFEGEINAPEPVSAKTGAVLDELASEANEWERAEGRKRDQLYGMSRAVAAVSADAKVLTSGRKQNKVRDSLRAEVLPRNSGFHTEDVMRGFDRAIRHLREGMGERLLASA